jgi:hypothetical protein
MDETYDMMRAVRDQQFKYIRNYMPELPYAQPISYMDEMPTMQEMRRLAAEGKLTGPQTLFFRSSKPIEELYDITADPHEVNDLADDPRYRDVLERLRSAHELWTKRTGDLGLVPEPVLDERMRPGGKWSTTAAPQLMIRDGTVVIQCPTEGASIAYALAPADAAPAHWLLYTGPFSAAPGTLVRARATRLGFRESEEAQATVQ